MVGVGIARLDARPSELSRRVAGDDCAAAALPAGRFDMAAIAALVTCTSGGLIPHARHGGKGVLAFAVAGSKFDGTGFEKEHIGQIQVAFVSLGGGGVGEENACRVGEDDGV